MMTSRWIVAVSSVPLAFLFVTSIWAQLPDRIGDAAKSATESRLQAQSQQRIQTQIQQRAQTQVQQQVRAQAQARLQAEAARAAQVARGVAAAAQRQAAMARQSASANARVNADARLRNESQVGNQAATIETEAAANADAQFELREGTQLPAGVTQADVQIYDNIFGRFNPFRRPDAQPVEQPSEQAPQNQPPGQTTEQPAGQATERPSGQGQPLASGGPSPSENPLSEPPSQPSPQNPDQNSQRPTTSQRGPLNLGLRARGNGSIDFGQHMDWNSRVHLAIRERRAEISQLRDRALAAGEARLLFQAEQMDAALNAFVEAQAQQEAAARGLNGNVDRANASSEANVETRLESNAKLRTTRGASNSTSNVQGGATQKAAGTVR